MRFTIPKPVMPTIDEHRKSSAAWLSRIGPCLYENWPVALRSISFPTTWLELNQDDIEALLAMMDGKLIDNLPRLRTKIDQSLQAYPDGCFAKLSSRSPKDFWGGDNPCRYSTAKEILDIFASSERILSDLVEYEYADTKCYMIFREYHKIPKHEEFRCFVRDGKIAAVTQYHYRDQFHELSDPAWKSLCFDFLNTAVLPILHLPMVVIDLWMRPEPMVIEINPYGLSDPCLFDYAEIESEFGQFRILR